MRNNIVHIGGGRTDLRDPGDCRYRRQTQALGLKTNMENIGDPVAKGEQIPAWMKQIVADLAMQDCSYGYCPTRGVLETRAVSRRADTTARQAADHPRGHPLLQRPRRCHPEGLRLSAPRGAGHRPLADLLDPLLGRSRQCRAAAGLLPPRPGQPLVSRPGRAAAIKVKYNPAIAGILHDQSRQPHRRGLSGSGPAARSSPSPGSTTFSSSATRSTTTSSTTARRPCRSPT